MNFKSSSIKILIYTIFLILNKISCDINIHIIPHTHLDPGWLKTPEEYYQSDSINSIFFTVLNSLTSNPDRTFVINEIYYFKIWYESINNEEKEKVKKLISEKRIEFVFCGYTVNDEANPIYYDIIDNIRIGHQFLLEEFNITPKSAWFLDSFGHNAGNAHIASQMGFDSLVLGRFHENYLELFKDKKLLEFYWDMFGNNNSEKKILTHIMALHYGYTLFIPELEDHTESVMPKFIMKLKEILKGIKHKNILFLFGDDFKYKDGSLFNCIDNLKNQFEIKQSYAQRDFGINEKINLFYSTPEKYFLYMKQELEKNNQNLETITHKDFYPLRTDCFWTGYFTSRPYLKGFIRKGSNAFYTFSKYFSFNKFTNNLIKEETYKNLKDLREMVALTQHHDAITGTCKQYVASDYIFKLENAISKVEEDFKNNIEEKFKIKISQIKYNNHLSNEKSASAQFVVGEKDIEGNIKIGIYNPMITNDAEDISHQLINIEISESKYEYEIEGIKSNFFCINDETEFFNYNSKCFLDFFLDFKKGEEITFIKLKKTSNEINNEKYIKFDNKQDTNIELIREMNIIKSLTFNPKLFNFNIQYLDENEEITKINFSYYDGMYYVNAGRCMDGAYVFSPYNKYPDPISIDYKNSFYYKGDIGITFVTRNQYTSFTIFTFFYEPFFAKAVHIFDNIDNNYFLKRFSFAYNFVLKTDINNLNNNHKPIFYTDANGLEPMQRIIETFDYEEKDVPSTGGNFYPVTSFISIKDENGGKRMITLFTDRPQGGTGYLPGSVSLSLQRMSYGSDNKGLNENMHENESMGGNDFTTTHLITFGNNINTIKNKKERYMESKTTLLNLVYNYLNKATILFKIKECDNDLSDIMKQSNELLSNIQNKYITISWDIRANYEIINDNLVIGRYFRYNNYIFNSENLKDDNDNFGNINLNFEGDVKFKIFYDKTGINYKTKDNNEIISKEILDKFQEPKKQKISLKYNEFIFIYFYFGK